MFFAWFRLSTQQLSQSDVLSFGGHCTALRLSFRTRNQVNQWLWIRAGQVLVQSGFATFATIILLPPSRDGN
jgi:hypothetical protein